MWIPKCVAFLSPPNAIKYKYEKVCLGEFILKYNVLKVICYQNHKRSRNFGDIGSFGDMGTGRNLAKNREIA